ncbi:MAG: hypothetical protein K0S70_97 [Microbacterium sp.]|jgi:hypothetical protein|nr:hypothetical protein [Microbacterium sp.]
MAQTAAQRKAAEAKAAEKAAEEDEFGSSSETPPTDAPEGSAGDSGAAQDDTAETAADDRKAVDTPLSETPEQAKLNSLLYKLGDALGFDKDEDGTITASPDAIVEATLEQIAEFERQASEPAPAPEVKSGSPAAAVRLTIEEVDGAGKALRKWGQLVPIAQANPAAVAETVKATVEEIVAVPVGPVQALEQQPVED